MCPVSRGEQICLPGNKPAYRNFQLGSSRERQISRVIGMHQVNSTCSLQRLTSPAFLACYGSNGFHHRDAPQFFLANTYNCLILLFLVNLNEIPFASQSHFDSRSLSRFFKRILNDFGRKEKMPDDQCLHRKWTGARSLFCAQR